MPVAGARDEEYAHNNPNYDTTMDLFVASINKIIKINGGKYMRELMNLPLERLKYSPEHLLIVVKSIQVRQKIF